MKATTLKGKAMKRLMIMTMMLAMAGGMFAQQAVEAEPATHSEGWTAFQFSLVFGPFLQWPDDSYTVRGWRWNLGYARCRDLTGLDLGIANHCRGTVKGLQFGVWNMATDNSTGMQMMFYNHALAGLDGVQLGLCYNLCRKKVYGLQFASYNYCGDVHGVQLGFINVARIVNGIQIGLFNINTEGPIPVFPIVNGCF